MRLRVIILILPFSLIAAHALLAAEEPDKTEAERIEYFGYKECIRLENRGTRVVLCLHGGRVLEYSRQGKNALYLDPAQEGWTHAPGKQPVDPCGGRFDIGPEMTIPRHPDLWLGKWQGEITGSRSARLTSPKDEPTGTQLIREFALDESASKLTCRQIIQNMSDRTTAWCHWSRTLAKGGGICLIPLTENSRFPNQYVMYGPDSTILYRPQDPNIRVRDGFLEIIATPEYPKLGMDSHAGWLGYLLRDDLLFVKRFPTFPDRVYNEIVGLTISIWYYKDLMCELEPIGPMERLDPGQSASFTEEWWLVPYAYPGKGADVDLKRLAGAVDKLTGMRE